MISRRNFFTIFLMMMILLFMFQFSMVIQENGNEYDTNEYFREKLATATDAWVLKKGNSETDYSDGEYTLFIGEQDCAVQSTVEQWCLYTKNNLVLKTSFASLTILNGHLPKLILVDGKSVDVPAGIQFLTDALNQGITVIFCSLPEPSVIAENQELMKLLGIEEVRENTTKIEGVRLFSGFLLGGEIVYKAGTPEDEEKLQDFDLSIPWYITGKGSKTYMVGLKDEDEVEREDFPRLIWRSSMQNGMVFAMEGDFCESLTGLGLLSACVYESSDYTIYPIVNAQTTVLADYPSLSQENEAEMERIYDRSAEAVMRDIMWPGILSMATRNDLTLTCYLQTKYDYDDPAQPTTDELKFYLQQLKESGGEAGKSFDYTGTTTLQEKIIADNDFYSKAHYGYKFGSAYVGQIDDELKEALGRREASNIHSITCEDRGDLPLLSYYTDNTTLLGVTDFAEQYSYTTDLRIRSLATALGYSNIMINMNKVVWPKSKDDHWQNYFDEIFSNMSTYFSKHQYFEQTSMSTSDARTRALLNTDYSIRREGNTIYLHVDNVTDDTYYLLRTHGQDINRTIGAWYEEIEEGVYCLQITYSDVQIDLTQSEDIFTYDGPF